MESQILVAVAACSCLGPGFEHVPSRGPRALLCTATYQQIKRLLPKEGQRAKSARLELEYWYKAYFADVVRKSVETKDGKAAEVVFLNAPTLNIPGTDFSMGFLMVDNRVIDWASCWTFNWYMNQELMLEDVDGDGSLDLAFRASKGVRGFSTKRIHSRPGDDRNWLYAYAITSRGLQSLFPSTERDLSVKLDYDTGGHPVTLRVDGLPKSLRGYQMYEYTISATNTSRTDLPIKPGWFDMDVDVGGYLMDYGPWDKRKVLKAGETVSHTVRFMMSVSDADVTLRWKFTPGGPDIRAR